MSYYAAPFYLGVSCILSSIYGGIEFVKEKGTLDTATSLILCSWCITTIIIGSIVAGAAAEVMVGAINPLHLILALLLACITLSISGSLVYYS